MIADASVLVGSGVTWIVLCCLEDLGSSVIK